MYDTYEANAGIRVLDLSSGVDSPLTAGNFPKLANDGHRFTYLNATASIPAARSGWAMPSPERWKR